MTERDKLIVQAEMLGCEKATELSEFELHRFIRENEVDEPIVDKEKLSDEKNLNIFNVFQILNAPDDPFEREEMADNFISRQFYHVNKEEGYFLVVHNTVHANSGMQAIKLDPANDEQRIMMADIIKTAIDSEVIKK